MVANPISGKEQIRIPGNNPFKNPLFLAGVILYVLILFVDGMRVHLFCDELSFLKNVGGFFVYRTIEPIYTNYPTFFSYLLSVPIYIAYFINYIFVHHYPWSGLGDPRLFALVFQIDINIWLWVGRAISIIFAAGTLALVYRYCVSRMSRPALLVVLFLLISSPFSLYMIYARYSLPDVMLAFLATGILGIASKYVEQPNPNNKSLYFAGFLTGIAASAKLNGILTIAPLLVIPWIVSPKRGQKFPLVFSICAWALFGFFAGSPCNVLKPWIYSSGFNLESQILYSPNQDFNFKWLMPTLWQDDPVMTTLLIAAIGFSVWRHSKKDMLFHAILIPSVIFLGGLAKRTPHYLLFLFPWVCVVIGQFFHEILKPERKKYFQLFFTAVLVMIVAYESHRLTTRLIQDSKTDNRDIAGDWIKKNISPDEHILLDVEHVPDITYVDIRIMPPEEYINKNKYREIIQEYARRESFHYVVTIPSHQTSINNLKAQGWKYFVTSNFCFQSYLQDPSKLDAVEYGANKFFIEYLFRRSFYMQLFRENVGVRVFREGSGPEVYLFRLL